MAESAAARIYALERDRDRFDRDVFGDNGLEVRVDRVESRVDVMGAKLGAYAAMGSLIGGGIVAGVLKLVLG